MEGQYPVFYNEQVIGSVQIRRIGLYYELKCSCSSKMEGIWRLFVINEGRIEDLGVLVLENRGMCLLKRIAIKNLAIQKPVFGIRNNAEMVKDAVAIHAEKPFAYLTKIDCAYLIMDGKERKIGFQKIP